jgi:hypothetical protein
MVSTVQFCPSPPALSSCTGRVSALRDLALDAALGSRILPSASVAVTQMPTSTDIRRGRHGGELHRNSKVPPESAHVEERERTTDERNPQEHRMPTMQTMWCAKTLALPSVGTDGGRRPLQGESQAPQAPAVGDRRHAGRGDTRAPAAEIIASTGVATESARRDRASHVRHRSRQRRLRHHGRLLVAEAGPTQAYRAAAGPYAFRASGCPQQVSGSAQEQTPSSLSAQEATT